NGTRVAADTADRHPESLRSPAAGAALSASSRRGRNSVVTTSRAASGRRGRASRGARVAGAGLGAAGRETQGFPLLVRERGPDAPAPVAAVLDRGDEIRLLQRAVPDPIRLPVQLTHHLGDHGDEVLRGVVHELQAGRQVAWILD